MGTDSTTTRTEDATGTASTAEPAARSAGDPTTVTRANVRARIFAALALTGFVSAGGYAGHQAYRAATDSFVAPIILSPDNDLVLQTKAKMSELEVERSRIHAESEAIDADLAASEKALAHLRTLQATIEGSLEWTKELTVQKAAASSAELQALARQRDALVEIAARQAAEGHGAYDHTRLALLDNERIRIESESHLNQAYLAQRALSAKNGMMMPEAVAREEHLVRIELEIVRLESEQRAKRAERKVVSAKLAKMDELEAQLRGRPLFRATERSLEVAFVPYSQSEGVFAGATVYECVWGIFHCNPVGSITEIVAGEVVLPDPWGSPARGQYAVLDLHKHESAKAKVLRVRGGTALPARTSSSAPQTVSQR
jgi:hypothetical protein